MRSISNVLWAAAVFTLPITSLPILIRLSKASTVAPPAVVLFIVLALVWLVPYVGFRGLIPREGGLLALFIGIALISWAASFFQDVSVFRDHTNLTEGREALLTLSMAAITYYVAAAWLGAERRNIQLTLRVLNYSGLALILWSAVQWIFVAFFQSNYPPGLIWLQNLFSSRDNPLFFARITGFAYEPSWLAHMLVLVYLPVWLSASLQGYSAHRFGLGKVRLENLLLVGGLFVLFESFSRIGWLSFFLMAAYLLVRLSFKLVRYLYGVLSARLSVRPVLQPLVKAVIYGLIFTLFVAGYTAVIIGILWVGSRVEPRLQLFFNPRLWKASSFLEFSNYLFFAERAVYWATGWAIFNDHPWLGVGLGNAGLFFFDKVPAFGWALTEIHDLYSWVIVVPNTKSLWVRILAETGFIGFSVFFTWVYTLFQSARLTSRVKERDLRVIGWAGQLAIIGFITEGFSIDSFALPYFWFVTGILSGAALIGRRMIVQERLTSTDK